MKPVRNSISAVAVGIGLATVSLLPVNAPGASAQSLSKEITVDRDIVLTHREANRLTTLPRVSLPALSRPSLTFADYTSSSSITNDLETLPPVSYDVQLPSDPCRGYVTAGYFPLQRADLGAGFRVLDTGCTRLNAWLQYNRNQYRSRYSAPVLPLLPVALPGADRFTLKSDRVALGADFTLATSKRSALSASAAYLYSRHLFPALGSTALDLSHIGANQIDLSVGYRGESSTLGYHVGAALNHFAYTGESMPQFTFSQPRPRETEAKLSAGLSHTLSSLTIGLDGDFAYVAADGGLRYRGFRPEASMAGSIVPPSELPYVPYTNGYRADYGVIRLRPYVGFRASHLRGTAGINLDLTLRQGTAFHASPEVNVAWTPVRPLTVGLKAAGGVVRNTLSSLYTLTPYQFAGVLYENSLIPVDAELSLLAGPHRSLWGKLSVGFSVARGWLMPFYAGGATVWSPCDLRGWRLEAAAGYSWRGIVDVEASVAMAPHETDRGYYLWRDRAGLVADVSLSLHPLRPLTVKAAWQLRALRHGNLMFTDQVVAALGVDVYQALYPLDNVSDLSLSASWQFTPALSVWAEGCNLLNRHSDTITPFAAQGRTAMVGLSWRF